MARTFITSTIAGVFLLAMGTAALAVTGEPGDLCSMGLVRSTAVERECSISSGKTDRFGVAMADSMKKPKKYFSGQLKVSHARTTTRQNGISANSLWKGAGFLV